MIACRILNLVQVTLVSVPLVMGEWQAVSAIASIFILAKLQEVVVKLAEHDGQ